ncbi:hypothetical protein HHJ49_00030 [Escherichia coli]|nr:hypothetical protein HHJ49_00030 [Escherichia coli]
MKEHCQSGFARLRRGISTADGWSVRCCERKRKSPFSGDYDSLALSGRKEIFICCNLGADQKIPSAVIFRRLVISIWADSTMIASITGGAKALIETSKTLLRRIQTISNTDGRYEMNPTPN